jgi:hypothetical protein
MSASTSSRTSRSVLPPALFRSREELAAYINRGVYPSDQQGGGGAGGARSVASSKINRWEIEEKLEEAGKTREQKLVNRVRDGIIEGGKLFGENQSPVSPNARKPSPKGKPIPLSPGELETVRKREMEARRKLRIQQVRDQEKLYAAKMIRKRNALIAEKKAEVVAAKRKEWEDERQRDMVTLESRFKRSVVDIGHAQRKAAVTVGEQAQEARQVLRAWDDSERATVARHREAIHAEKTEETEQRRQAKEAAQRETARVNEQQHQRFKAHQYRAAIDEAKKQVQEQQTVEVDYDVTDVVRQIIAPVQSQGPGIVDYSKTHFHHAVTRHHAPGSGRGAPNVSKESIAPRQHRAGESAYRSELQMGVNRGPMLSGPEGALLARKRQIEREAKREADAALGRERARQRSRTAAEKLRMEEEFSTITKQLKILDMSNRAERLKAFAKAQRAQVLAVARDSNAPNWPKAGGQEGAEDSFERMFVDEESSFSINDSNVQVNDSGSMAYRIKTNVAAPAANLAVIPTASQTDEGPATPKRDAAAHGAGDGSPQRSLMEISAGLSQLAGELAEASANSPVRNTSRTAAERAGVDPEEFYQSYLSKYASQMEQVEPAKPAVSEARIQMRLQMRRDRQKATQAKVAAAKKQQKEDEEGPGLTPEEEDSLFLFEVGAKKPKGPAGMVDVAVGYGGATQGAPKAANTEGEEVKSGEEDEEETMLVANAAAAAVAHHIQSEVALEFSTDSLGLSPGPKDEDPISLIAEAQLALSRAEATTQETLDEMGAQLDTGEENFMSALDEANEVLRTLEELTHEDESQIRDADDSEDEDDVPSDNPATLVVDVPKVPSTRGMTKAWEVDMGGVGQATKPPPPAVARRLEAGKRAKISIEEARSMAKTNVAKIDKKKKYKSGAQMAREKERKRQAVLARQERVKEADRARRAILIHQGKAKGGKAKQ